MNHSTVITVGLDVHKATIAVCALRGLGQDEELREIPNDPRALQKLFRRLADEGEVQACYEAGPCGFEVHRQLKGLGIACAVIAPALIPRKPGDRVKTDRRDARNLARYFRAGELTAIHVPDRREEAVRDLVRCREDLVQETTRLRKRLSAFLLRQGRIWSEGKNWTQRHFGWLRKLQFEFPECQRTFEEYLSLIDANADRIRALEAELARIAEEPTWKPMVDKLKSFPGIRLVTAMTFAAEIQDFRRFKSPRQLMSYIGMTPSLYASANTERRGPITKCGNAHVRRVLVEAAWHYRHNPQSARYLRKRTADAPQPLIDLVVKAQSRLHRRFVRLLARNKKPQVAVVAVARELLGFLWAALVQTETQNP